MEGKGESESLCPRISNGSYRPQRSKEIQVCKLTVGPPPIMATCFRVVGDMVTCSVVLSLWIQVLWPTVQVQGARMLCTLHFDNLQPSSLTTPEAFCSCLQPARVFSIAVPHWATSVQVRCHNGRLLRSSSIACLLVSTQQLPRDMMAPTSTDWHGLLRPDQSKEYTDGAQCVGGVG